MIAFVCWIASRMVASECQIVACDASTAMIKIDSKYFMVAPLHLTSIQMLRLVNRFRRRELIQLGSPAQEQPPAGEPAETWLVQPDAHERVQPHLGHCLT